MSVDTIGPPTDSAALAQLRRLQSAGVYGGATAAREEYSGYSARHNVYLGTTANALNPLNQKGVTQEEAIPGITEFDLVIDPDTHEAATTLDTEQLGLPAVSPEVRPLALLVHKRKGRPTLIECVGYDPSRTSGYTPGDEAKVPLTRYFLVNPAVTSDDENATPQPQWLQPGDAVFLDATSVGLQATLSKPTNTMRVSIAPDTRYSGTDDSLTADLIRPEPSEIDRAHSKATRSQERAGQRLRQTRVRRWVGATVLGLSSLVAPFLHKDDAATIDTADEMVLTDNTIREQDGRKQAEQFAAPETLGRIHEAFEAYYAGDTDRLRQLAEQNGHQANWIGADTIEWISQAESTTDLEQRFNSAMAGLPITLDIIETDSELSELIDEFHHTKAERLGDSIASAEQILRTLDAASRRYLGTLGEVDFRLVGNVSIHITL